MNGYRIQYTEMKPGGSHEPQDEFIRGTVRDARDYINSGSRRVCDSESIIITEHTQSDGIGPGRSRFGVGHLRTRRGMTMDKISIWFEGDDRFTTLTSARLSDPWAECESCDSPKGIAFTYWGGKIQMCLECLADSSDITKIEIR